MAQFNYMNLADTAGQGAKDRQAEEMNALMMDSRRQQMDQQEQVFDDKTRYENTRYGAGAATYLLQVMEQNPERVAEIMPSLNEQLQRRGLGYFEKTPTREDIELMRDRFMTALGGQRSTSNVTKTWVNPDTMTMWGMRQSGDAFDTGVPAQHGECARVAMRSTRVFRHSSTVCVL
jgi:hypothetical protein